MIDLECRFFCWQKVFWHLPFKYLSSGLSFGKAFKLVRGKSLTKHPWLHVFKEASLSGYHILLVRL